MTIQYDTRIGNKTISSELNQLFSDLANHINSTFETLEKVKIQARKEGFSDDEIYYLSRKALGKVKSRGQLDYFFHGKRRYQEKTLGQKHEIMQNNSNNLPDLPLPDYKTVGLSLEQEKPQVESYQQNHVAEELRLQLDQANNKIEEQNTQIKTLEEKYKQLEGERKPSPTNSIPTLQGNNLRTKVILSQIFRDILNLKGPKMIYANILIDVSQNKYIRLEPIDNPNTINR
jgi:hypothetical protein